MVLVTYHMRVNAWEDFQKAHRAIMPKAKEMGCTSSQVYQAEGDPTFVMILQEWPSHHAMHQFSEQYEYDFHEQAKLQGEWEVWVWGKADV